MLNVSMHAKIDHFAHKFNIEIVTSLYRAKHTEYTDIFMTKEQKIMSC